METLALIILNYNSFEDCVVCVDRLLSFNEKFHIILVDNKSTDGSYDKLKEKYSILDQVDIIQTNTNAGYSSGNNYGINYAMKKYAIKTVGIINPDVLIPEIEVLQVMLDKLYLDDSFAIIGGLAIDIEGNYNPNSSSWEIPSLKNVVLDHFLINRTKKRSRKISIIAPKLACVECVVGCFFLAKTSHLGEMGFFDENVFLYNEENILGIKCKRMNYKEVLALDQFYYHNHRHVEKITTFTQKILSTKNSYESRKYLCKTYYSKIGLPFLWMIEMLNRMYLSGCYLKNKLSP